MKKAWRIVARHPDYEISETGAIRRRTPGRGTGGGTWVGRVLSPCATNGGYLYVCMDHQRETVHALVCETWHGPRPSPLHHAAHRDGKNQNNTPRNMRWKTKDENDRDRARHGKVRGKKNPAAKLTEEKVAWMKKIAPGKSQSLIAEAFGVSNSMVSLIMRGKNWSHVKAAA